MTYSLISPLHIRYPRGFSPKHQNTNCCSLRAKCACCWRILWQQQAIRMPCVAFRAPELRDIPINRFRLHHPNAWHAVCWTVAHSILSVLTYQYIAVDGKLSFNNLLELEIEAYVFPSGGLGVNHFENIWPNISHIFLADEKSKYIEEVFKNCYPSKQSMSSLDVVRN